MVPEIDHLLDWVNDCYPDLDVDVSVLMPTEFIMTVMHFRRDKTPGITISWNGGAPWQNDFKKFCLTYCIIDILTFEPTLDSIFNGLDVEEVKEHLRNFAKSR